MQSSSEHSDTEDEEMDDEEDVAVEEALHKHQAHGKPPYFRLIQNLKMPSVNLQNLARANDAKVATLSSDESDESVLRRIKAVKQINQQIFRERIDLQRLQQETSHETEDSEEDSEDDEEDEEEEEEEEEVDEEEEEFEDEDSDVLVSESDESQSNVMGELTFTTTYIVHGTTVFHVAVEIKYARFCRCQSRTSGTAHNAVRRNVQGRQEQGRPARTCQAHHTRKRKQTCTA